jgi:hypothetical protein
LFEINSRDAFTLKMNEREGWIENRLADGRKKNEVSWDPERDGGVGITISISIGVTASVIPFSLLHRFPPRFLLMPPDFPHFLHFPP